MEAYLEKLWNNCDKWLILGFLAQACFTLRFVVQWMVSEAKKQSVIPISFWYLSIAGSTGLLVYSIKRAEPIFILGYLFNNIVYIRNLMLIMRQRKNSSSDCQQ